MRHNLECRVSTAGHILQLKPRRGNENRFSSHVLPRIVRLTIETNTLTGVCPSNSAAQ